MAKPNFEESFARLEKIVTQLEAGDIPLEKMLKMYEEGRKLVETCNKRLKEAEKKIEILVHAEDGTVKTEPFKTEEEKE